MSKDALIARIVIVLGAFASLGAVARTPNFVVHAPTSDIAKQVGIAAEHYRDKLAFEWLGKKFARRWSRPCHITVRVGRVGAGGETKFTFHNGHVFGWKMTVQGSLERILDSVLPHEISHTIFACHFRRPLPRWADEGAATLAEDSSEKLRQQRLVEQILKSERRIPLRKLLTIQEYPRNMQSVLTLYAQGFSLAQFLIEQGGKSRYLEFLEDAHQRGWDSAIRRHYKLRHVDALEKSWSNWVVAGSPTINLTEGQLLAMNHSTANGRSEPDLIVRSQTPESHEEHGTKATNDARTSWTLTQSTGRWEIPGMIGRIPIRLPQGKDLHAPDPRRVKDKLISVSRPLQGSQRQFQPNRSQSISMGRRRALNDGWIPISPEH